VNHQAYIRTDEDLRQAAEVQFRALKISADHFDLGEMGEAPRMANALFVLAGEGARTHRSILDAADQKQGRLYRSTKSSESVLGCSLVHLKLTKVGEDTWEYGLGHAGRAALRGGRDLTFGEWWKEFVIVNDKVSLSRSDVVRFLRDKNGGAHFDPVVTDPRVARAIRGDLGLFGIEHPDGKREIVPFGLEFCMRQIATEFWFSLDREKGFDVVYENNCVRGNEARASVDEAPAH
jgi:hypothetical protein